MSLSLRHTLCALVLCLSAAPFASADGTQAPPSFTIAGHGLKAVLVNFTAADYSITFDITKKVTRIHSEIQFTSPEIGYPVFDLFDEPTALQIDGKSVSHIKIAPAADSINKLRVVLSEVNVGSHTLTVDHEINGNLNRLAPIYSAGTVQSGFFMDDDWGMYLQNFLPSTFEFSQYPMAFHVALVGASEEHSFFTNGAIQQTDASHWTIQFPNYFNCSAVYFHVIPKDLIVRKDFSFDDGTGTLRPGVAYQKKTSNEDLDAYVATATAALADLTHRFGKFPHSSLVLYNGSDNGGMEYSGASVTQRWAIPHELAHSYFGRGVMPANGNAGWIDEAMATLTEGPYHPDPNSVTRTPMASHSPYYTQNDDYGYHQGMNVLARFGEKFNRVNSAHSIEDFLKHFFAQRVHQTMTTELLKADLESYGGISLTSDFEIYVYGRGAAALPTPWGPTAAPKLRRHQSVEASFRALQSLQ